MGGLQDAIGRINSLHGVTVAVGVQGTSSTTAPGPAGPSELVTIATANEYGTATIPARPFLRSAARKRMRVWVRGLDAAVSAKADGNDARATMTLRRLGVVMVSDVQISIRSGDWVPNAPATVARKGSDRPLIDTGQLIQSIRASVEVPGRPPEVVG